MDDGSCVSIPGCTNPDADNYDPAATLDDGSCVIVGCTDPTALNYEANATQADDASCYYTLPSVIVNEIHYNPCGAQGDDFDYEFVELLNIGDVTVDLSGYEFYNESAGDDQLSLVFPKAQAWLQVNSSCWWCPTLASRRTAETDTKCLCLTQATSATLEKPFPCATPLETW